MSDILTVFKEFNTMSKQLIISVVMMGSFWTVPFCLFKPEIFEFPFYAQLALIFSLTMIWMFVCMLSSLIILNLIDEEYQYTFIFTAIFGIILICISILISYYYSNSFTYFLRIAFSVVVCYALLQVVLFYMLFAFNWILQRNRNSV